MNYSNPPKESPEHVTHKTFHSNLLNHEIGYNIYLPPDYETSGKRYPVAYHLHGYTGNESSEIWALAEAYRSREAITVFMNVISSEEAYLDAVLQIESILINELIPHIEEQFRTCGDRSISGFSMGGAMAFYYAVKHPELFGLVTGYAGTFHHLFHKDYHGVGEPVEKSAGFYETMIQEKKYLDEDGILYLIRKNAEKVRGKLRIHLHIGTDDVLICDNEIMRMDLSALDIPHEYKVFEGAGHELSKILQKKGGY